MFLDQEQDELILATDSHVRNKLNGSLQLFLAVLIWKSVTF